MHPRRLNNFGWSISSYLCTASLPAYGSTCPRILFLTNTFSFLPVLFYANFLRVPPMQPYKMCYHLLVLYLLFSHTTDVNYPRRNDPICQTKHTNCFFSTKQFFYAYVDRAPKAKVQKIINFSKIVAIKSRAPLFSKNLEKQIMFIQHNGRGQKQLFFVSSCAKSLCLAGWSNCSLSYQGLLIFISNCLRPRRTLEMWTRPLLRCNRSKTYVIQVAGNKKAATAEVHQMKSNQHLHANSQMWSALRLHLYWHS